MILIHLTFGSLSKFVLVLQSVVVGTHNLAAVTIGPDGGFKK